MRYHRLGQSGLMLPAISLGMWHNFGGQDSSVESRKMILHAFEQGITHFDLANNYGNPPGSAESTLGKILKTDLAGRRDEIIITTKAGWDMWSGPYGNFGSRKHLRASLDQSLKRLAVDYIDLFYHHRPDPETPIEETIMTLVEFVKRGQVLYLGLCGYSAENLKTAAMICRNERVPLIAFQGSHSLLFSQYDEITSATLETYGIGGLAYCPLFQGVLTGKYLHKIPKGSRMQRSEGHLSKIHREESLNQKIKSLKKLAESRGQTLTEMSLAWTLIHPRICSTIIGTRNMSQLNQNLKALHNLEFSNSDLQDIKRILSTSDVE